MGTEKSLPLAGEALKEIANQHKAPFHLYDEKGILRQIENMQKHFSWVKGFTNYFAVKACPNPAILKLMLDSGFGVDCSSLTELELVEQVGFSGEQIMFTSNDTPVAEFAKAKELGAIINLDDITHIETLESLGELPELVCFRYNPGDSRTGNLIIGTPTESKYGLTREQIFQAYSTMKEKGVERFGLHTMVASNELDPTYIIETANMLFDLAVELKKRLDISVEFVNMGGGVGIPYRPEQDAMDLKLVSMEIKKSFKKMMLPANLDNTRVVFELGRAITGPYGYLVTEVLHVTEKYKRYVGVNASMADLMRPAIYGAYHHITVVGKSVSEETPEVMYDVTGSLCENNDKFAVDRKLPKIEKGDLLVIHDTGAHGYAMGFNYNGKLRSAEYMLRSDGTIEKIRRAETINDYFATLRFEGATVKV